MTVPRFLLWAVLAIVMVGMAQAFSNPSVPHFYDATAEQIGRPPGTLLRYEPLRLPALFRGKAYRILYASRDYANRPIATSGVAVISTAKGPRERTQQIIAWAHPTVGTAALCAPSMRQAPVHYIGGLNELIGAGYTVVATDYPGLGTPGPIGYLIGKGQAHAVLDSVRAAYQLPGQNFASDYAVYGYSQGAHAALFAAMEAPSYMPDFVLKGIAAIAAPTDLTRLFAANEGSMEGKVLFSYTLQSWAVKYGLALRDVLSDTAIPTVMGINRICIDNFSGVIAAVSAQDQFGATIFTGNPLTHPQWRQRLHENSLSVLPTNVPIFMVQGGADTIVRPGITEAAIQATCRSGGNVKILYLRDKGHSGSFAGAFPAVSNWLTAIMNGQRQVSSCR